MDRTRTIRAAAGRQPARRIDATVRTPGNNEPVTGPSLLQAAVDELYSAPLAEFTARRKALATQARKSGDRVAGTAIGALRKPTLSADTVNRLVRSAPAEVGELLQLGADLRSAEQALDAAELRRLGDRRRRLVGDLAELAFEITGQTAPSGSVRDEVTATLNAALADEEVAQRLSSGALVTQARWDGFGSTQLPELASSIPLGRPRALTGQTRADPAKPERPTPESRPGSSTQSDDEAASTDQAPSMDRARSKKQALSKDRAPSDKVTAAQKQAAAAQQAAVDHEHRAAQAAAAQAAQRAAAQQAAAAHAAQAAQAAASDAARAQELVSSIDRRISELNLQLAHQRQLLADAQRALRAAENLRRATALAATRAGAPVS